MLIRERMQRISFRLADLTCSVIAFTGDYQNLLPARDFLHRLLDGGNDLIAACRGSVGPRKSLAEKNNCER